MPITRTGNALWEKLTAAMATGLSIFGSWKLFQYTVEKESTGLAFAQCEGAGSDIYNDIGDGDNGETPIYRVVLTGGPCAGKSTALTQMSTRLRSLGFNVFLVPEAATLVFTGGGMYGKLKLSTKQRLNFEACIIKTKTALEDVFTELAKGSGKPSVIICDRGTMDSAAYLSNTMWQVLLDEYGWSIVKLRDRRYDAVVHMVTAAIGAESYYTTQNNNARTEGLAEARALDFRILNSWIGHPRLIVIDNSTGFQEKINRVVASICKILGQPHPVGSTRKFMVGAFGGFDKSLKVEEFDMEQTYLLRGKGKDNARDGFVFVQQRGQNGNYTYTYSGKNILGEETPQQIIQERQISLLEYVALLEQADPERIKVKKRVSCFTWKNQYYELVKYLEPNAGLIVLKTETESPDQQIELPPFVTVLHEVTNEAEYNSFNMAKKQMGL